MQSWGWRAGSAANRAHPALPKDQLIRSQQSRQAAHNHLQLTTASSAIQGHLACGIHSHIHVDKNYFKMQSNFIVLYYLKYHFRRDSSIFSTFAE